MVSERIRLYLLGIDRTLLVGLLGGIICVFIDIDHPIALSLGIEYGRFLHPYYFVISCLIISCCVAYIGGLLFKRVLRGKRNA